MKTTNQPKLGWAAARAAPAAPTGGAAKERGVAGLTLLEVRELPKAEGELSRFQLELKVPGLKGKSSVYLSSHGGWELPVRLSLTPGGAAVDLNAKEVAALLVASDRSPHSTGPGHLLNHCLDLRVQHDKDWRRSELQGSLSARWLAKLVRTLEAEGAADSGYEKASGPSGVAQTFQNPPASPRLERGPLFAAHSSKMEAVAPLPEFPPTWQICDYLRSAFGAGPPRSGTYPLPNGMKMVVAFHEAERPSEPDYRSIRRAGGDAQSAWVNWISVGGGAEYAAFEGRSGSLTVSIERSDGTRKRFEGYSEHVVGDKEVYLSNDDTTYRYFNEWKHTLTERP